MFNGNRVTLGAVQTYRSKKVRLESDGIIAYADGDRVGPLPVTIEAVPRIRYFNRTGRSASGRRPLQLSG
ncbi:hypothetical protein [Rhodococcus erythropolis]|uniref:hypothetical protein n=1 Tax=Rhodococcus erythropolis TaxID=1833 RepID=UPI002032A7A2|nr:hypothetical protein [Rhodococcus erythropolis]